MVTLDKFAGTAKKAILVTLPGQLFVFPIDHNHCGPGLWFATPKPCSPSEVADISATGRTRYTNLGIEIDEEDGRSEHTPAEHL